MVQLVRTSALFNGSSGSNYVAPPQTQNLDLGYIPNVPTQNFPV